jgi:hypothetical protein
MAKRRTTPSIENRLNALAVTLLDVYAQAEATLRCARDIHRHVVKLRSREETLTGGQRASIIEKMRSAASDMRKESNAMLPLIRDISRGVDYLE